VNDREEICEAFKTYYEGAEMGEEVDPARMYQLKGELDASGIYLAEEVERFCAIYFKPKTKQSAMDHQAMHVALDPAGSRFTVLQQEHEAEAEIWRGKVQAFRNLYGFLSQVIPYQDSDLERLYVFLRHLAAKLLRRHSGPDYQFDDDVRLEYYRLQKISEGSINLRNGDARPLDGPTEVGSGLVHAQPVLLSQLIDLVNERFGTDFNQADQLFFDQIVEAAIADDGLRQAAAVNPGDKFELVFKHLIENLFVERMDQNEEIFVRFMNDQQFQKVVTAWMASEAYKRLRSGPIGEHTTAAPRGDTGETRPQIQIVQPHPEERYVTCVLLVPLKAAAGAFSDHQHVEDDHWEWVAVDSKRRLRPGMFVAQVVGKSMEPTIPDGSYCLFRAPIIGTRQGKIVLVQLRHAIDPDTGERYTVKRYQSEKIMDGDSWRHTRITLKPINPDFQPIELTDAEEGELQVVAELVEVLGCAMTALT
jgi:type I restriction enzyme R subunit